MLRHLPFDNVLSLPDDEPRRFETERASSQLAPTDYASLPRQVRQPPNECPPTPLLQSLFPITSRKRYFSDEQDAYFPEGSKRFALCFDEKDVPISDDGSTVFEDIDSDCSGSCDDQGDLQISVDSAETDELGRADGSLRAQDCPDLQLIVEAHNRLSADEPENGAESEVTEEALVATEWELFRAGLQQQPVGSPGILPIEPHDEKRTEENVMILP